ncbi:MAG TPA: ABC transporter substrate-binding protein [Bradyrhizobium sp.]|jgi:putative ABC transport system substrate-binding protein|nr:ABC transporter substrate-binding protein [Bradyrhizobium sp.]
MRRREFVSLVGGAVAWPLMARAQQPTSLHIGIVTIQSRTTPIYAAFDQRLRELGHIEGQNLVTDYLNPERQAEGVPGAIKELVRQKVDIIVAPYESTVKAAIAASDTIPIVMIGTEYDPLARGYVKTLARPGGRVTGVFLQQIELASKRLQLLKDALPSFQAATMFWDNPSEYQWQAASSIAASLGLQLAGVEMLKQPYDYEGALASAPPDNRSILIIPIAPAFYRDRERLVEFAVRHRIASMFAVREFTDAGGLISYGPDFPAIFRRVAEYVDRIARGAKPADLPVEQPTKFELVINVKTAKAIGLDIPDKLIPLADSVIQ